MALLTPNYITMARLTSLVKDTAIYGMSSIVGRFLNYLLVPLYTNVISAASGGYGMVTNLYAYTALILVILTFGMETTFFRFANKEDEDTDTVFSTTMAMVSVLALAFLAAVFAFIDPLAATLHYTAHPEFLEMMAVVVALDAIQAIPFCMLRYQKRPLQFAALKLLFIVLNIGLNCVYFLVLGHDDVFGVFMLNLVCTSIIMVLFLPQLLRIRWKVDLALLRRMFSYSWPILVLGIAGILNQTADKMLFPLVCPDTAEANVQLGIYGACVKIAMIMAMITQAFRYAYEPFVFAQSKEKDKNETYAMAMKYFIIFTLLAFLCVMAYIGVLQYIIGKDYREGLRVVPIVMAAEIMMGVYFNLSFWYKLIDRTIWGAWFSLAGCTVLVAVNLIFIPQYGYMACAWGGFAGYGTAMVLSYIVGQRKNPIHYPMRSILTYTLLAIIGYACIELSNRNLPLWAALAVNTVVVIAFTAYLVSRDMRPILRRFKR